MAEALKKQAIDLSVKFRVLCPYTSLLVLETEQDYARFGIERRAAGRHPDRRARRDRVASPRRLRCALATTPSDDAQATEGSLIC
jgi:hypothetical protein